MYGLLVAMVAVGVFLTWARGDSLFNLLTIPAFEPGNRTIATQAGDLHALIGWVIVAAVGLHAGAAIAHRLLWRDGVLLRMLPAMRP